MTRIVFAVSDDLFSEDLRILFEAAGFRLKHCRNLQECLGQILEDPPDVLVVERGFAAGGEFELIKAVKACLQKANIPIIYILEKKDLSLEIDWSRLQVDDLVTAPFSPEELLARVRLSESRVTRVFDNNPLTRLPGNTSIIKVIERIITGNNPFAVGYVDIDNFKPYNDRYGFSRGDEVILMVARIIVNVIEEAGIEGSFVGHIGGDDFVFAVRRDFAEKVCGKILGNFEKVRNMFLSSEDIQVGAFVGKDRQNRETRFGLLSLSIAVVTVAPGKYQHYGEVSVAASQLKHYVKKIPGNSYLIDRRE